MNTKNLVLMALLVAVGAALYLIIPGFNGGMKFDFMLTMMFIGIFLFPDVRSVVLLAITTGILSGLFSTFPLGFFPNIVDKLISAFIVFAIVVMLKKFANNLIVATLVAGFGTLVSGVVFLSVAFFLLGVELPGLDNPFVPLFLTVVLPAVVMNSIAFFIIQPIVIKLMKRSSYKTAVTN